MKKKLIIINGTMGIGKSSICKEILKRLKYAVWLDGDWCWMMNPWIITEENKKMVEENIVFLLRNFLNNPTYRYIVFSWVIHKNEIYDILLNPLKDLDFEVDKITLMVNKNELINRLKKDSRDKESIKKSINRLEKYRSIDSVKIDISEDTPETAAEKIIEIVKTDSKQ